MTKLGVAVAVGVGLIALGADTIPLSEIEPGMTGYGLTVVAGPEISQFEVEVVAVLDEPGTRDDFIIIRAFGPAISRSGGVAQGMSGSPIYLDGRLAGALSRAAPWAADRERPLALVTPIEAMLEVLAEIAPPKTQPLPADGIQATESVLAVLQGGDGNSTGHSSPLDAEARSAPVMVSGLSPRALGALAQGLDLRVHGHPLVDLLPSWRGEVQGLLDLGVPRVLAAPLAPESTAGSPLIPGAPVGVGLAVGDIAIGALGTVTLAERNAVLAFGHPFLFTGSTRYFLTSARIFDTVAALDSPYKLGTVGEVVGGVFADRWAAVGGIVGRIPTGITISFHIHDASRTAEQALQVKIVDEPRLLALLLYVAGLEAVDGALDRIGQGTVSVQYTINGRGLPRPLAREDVFLSTHDVAPYVPWEAAVIADILAYNEFGDPLLDTIDVEATVQPGLSATEVLALETERDTYAPGDRVSFLVTLRGWRGVVEQWEGYLEIPADIVTPYVELRAYGGPRPREKGEGAPTFDSFLDLLDYIEEIPSYDTLTVELFAVDPTSAVIGETWLYGVNGLADRIPGSVVYGEVSLILPIEGK